MMDGRDERPPSTYRLLRTNYNFYNLKKVKENEFLGGSYKQKKATGRERGFDTSRNPMGMMHFSLNFVIK